MALKFALHTIHVTDNGKHKELIPGAVHEIADEHIEHLERAGAVREPTEQEIALYKLSTGQLVEAAAPAPKGKAPKGGSDDLVG